MVLKLPPRLPMPSPRTKMRGLRGHLVGQRFERRLHEGELARRQLGPARRAGRAARRRRGASRRLGSGHGAALGSLAAPRRPRRATSASMASSSARVAEPRSSNALAEPLDRAARLPGLDLLAGAVGEVAHALGVRPGAVGLAFEQRRPAARARRGDRFAGARRGPPATSLPSSSTPGMP